MISVFSIPHYTIIPPSRYNHTAKQNGQHDLDRLLALVISCVLTKGSPHGGNLNIGLLFHSGGASVMVRFIDKEFGAMVREFLSDQMCSSPMYQFWL